MRWRRFLQRARWDRERDEELRSYLEIETQENIARGMSPVEAGRAAHRKLGNTLRIREDIYEMNTIALLDSAGRDLRFAIRGMRRRPGFTGAVVLTLALGIGANTAIFSVVDGVLIRPLAYPDAHELVSLRHVARGAGAGDDLRMSASMYLTYRTESQTFEHVGLWGAGGRTLTGLDEPEQVRALFVTYGTLHALGVQPHLGRLFSEADDAPGLGVAGDGQAQAAQPVILTHGYWQRRFGGDSAAIGRRIMLDARPAEVVGIMPAGFRFLNIQPPAEVISTIGFNPSQAALDPLTLGGIARLKPGVTLEEANADVARMLPIWLNAWPVQPGGPTREVVDRWRLAPALRPLKAEVVGNVADMLWVLMGTIGLVLLIACANVANLMLVRSEGRREEFAVRTALGAGRFRIAKEVLVESLVLGALGGAVGLALAYAALRVLAVTGPTDLPRLEDISLDPRAVAFAAVASLMSSVAFGLIPAFKHTASQTSLARGARGASPSRERHRTRNTLVVVQVALALVLLVCAGLMIRTFQSLQSVNPGFIQADKLQTMRLWVPPFAIGDAEHFTRVQHEVLEKIRVLPGVDAAGFASSIPMEGRVNDLPIFVEGHTVATGDLPPTRRLKFVSPGFFEAMGTRIVAGRDVTWTDMYGRAKVVLVSENFAREVWGSPAAAIGRRIHEPGPPNRAPVWREIIGIVQDVYEDGVHLPAPSFAYWPVLMDDFLGQPAFGTRATVFTIRSALAGTESLMNEVRSAVWSVNASMPVFLVRTMQDLYDESLATTSFALVMLAIAGAMALGLGLIGIYGVISYVVSQRSREIGLRLALGAEPMALKRMFVVHGLRLTGIGVAAGLAAAVGLTRLMSSLLFGIGPLDPATYVAVLGIVATAAALASYMPARRAAAVNPMTTLTVE